MDESREHSPLKKAINAVTIDTTGLTIKEVVENILILVRKQCINI